MNLPPNEDAHPSRLPSHAPTRQRSRNRLPVFNNDVILMNDDADQGLNNQVDVDDVELMMETNSNAIDVDDLLMLEEEEGEDSEGSSVDSATTTTSNNGEDGPPQSTTSSSSIPSTIQASRFWPFPSWRQPPPPPPRQSTPSTSATVVKKSKPRHANRRWRFRQGMWNAGTALRPLEEGDEEEPSEQPSDGTSTERTSQVTPNEQDNGSAFHFGEGTCYASRWCQCFLMVVLCLLIAFLVLAALFFFVGAEGLGFPGEESSSLDNGTESPASGDAIASDWSFDPSIMDEDTPPRPLRDLLPSFTLERVWQDPASPQALAVAWVEQHPASLPNWKKLQLCALAAFYYAFNGNDWPADKRKDWLNYDVDECDWGDPGVEGQYFGVGCTQNTTHPTSRRFTDLNLDWFLGFGLVGFPDPAKGNEMPPELVFLTQLQSLGLMNCGLAAPLDQLLPPTLAQLPHLRRLSFRFNNIEGTIPPHLGDLTHLEYLSLGSNYLTGTLPPEMGGLTALQELFVYSNRLEGNLPYRWHKLTALTEFSAISNELTGTIPSFVADWPQLQYLFLDHNPLQGTLPPEVCTQLPELTSVLVPCSVDCGGDDDVCGELCACY